ncbi:MAG TPA: ABC transporter ATP-binding protein [Gammaproteobacteria bacterium]|nr:ABC transporter ATP-binding protein [Gammaproteobacteria bacterium]
MRGICKYFGSVRANEEVDLTVTPGEIIGLLGENGAGKTTLMNVLFGVYTADAGQIDIAGTPATIRNAADALHLGVGMVHQHFHLVSHHSVMENLLVGQPGRWGQLDRPYIEQRLQEIRSRFGLEMNLDDQVRDLSIGQQQRLEIIKALLRGARLLILDEPTASLTPQEADGLFDALRAMAAQQMGVIFISHKLHEIRAVTTRVVIMRYGRVTATVVNDDSTTNRQLAELMCEHEIVAPVKASSTPGRELLRLVGICTAGGLRPALQDIDLQVHAGEILGVAGVSGNGQTELADVMSGMLTPLSGQMWLDGQVLRKITPRQVQRQGLGRIPEDRMHTGLITTLPLSSCMVLPRIHEHRFSRFGVLNRKAIRQFTKEQMQAFDVRASGPDVRTGTLSGGNLQKVLLARELAWDPTVLLAAQPTRGLDIAAAQFVHEHLLRLRTEGKAVVLISEDLEELFALSDRIVVMYEGVINGRMPIAEATVQNVGLLMAGITEAA